MKKIIIAVISALLFTTMAEAQIQKTSSYQSETIASARMGVVQLKYDGDFFLVLTTSNQFDKPMLLKLGDNKESALLSLNDLLDLADSLQGTEMQSIDNGYEKELTISKSMGSLAFQARGYAGIAYLSAGEIKKFAKKLQAY
jgi:hypothetical protein